MVSKWRPENEFSLHEKQLRDQNLKNNFPKGIFSEIWLKLGDCEYIYIAEIKF